MLVFYVLMMIKKKHLIISYMVLTLKKVNEGTGWVEIIRLYFQTLENVNYCIENA